MNTAASRIRFRHFHNKKGRLVATIATQTEGDQIKIGLARCAPDDKPDKTYGRVLAAGRLVCGVDSLTMPLAEFQRRTRAGSLLGYLKRPCATRYADEPRPFKVGDRVRASAYVKNILTCLLHEHQNGAGTIKELFGEWFLVSWDCKPDRCLSYSTRDLEHAAPVVEPRPFKPGDRVRVKDMAKACDGYGDAFDASSDVAGKVGNIGPRPGYVPARTKVYDVLGYWVRETDLEHV